jgi:ParE toxin of type II toxin-antitoxin system, parDE
MTLPVRIEPKARVDLVVAAEWYEEQDPDANLPLQLFEEFDSVVQLIAERPEAFPIFESDVRRAILSQFPYGIYYTVEPHAVVVLYFTSMAQEVGPDA